MEANESKPGWLWHCPFTACWLWSFVGEGDVIYEPEWGGPGNPALSVDCPACGRRDTYVHQADVDTWLPGKRLEPVIKLGEAS